MKTKFLEYEKNNQKTKRVFCLHFDENYGANSSYLIVFGNRNISFPVPQHEQEDWEKRLNFVVVL